MTTPSSSPSSRGPKPRLSHDEIVEAALELLARDGREALNLRALAADLGVSTMALYRYFDGKDALLDAIVAGVLAGVTLDPTLAWDARLTASFTQLYEALRRHPAVAEIAALRRPGSLLDPLRDALYTTITDDGGFTEPEASRALRALSSYVFGFALVTTPRDRARQARTDFDYGLELLVSALRRDRLG